MPELDAVTQTFYANVDPYIDSIREAMRVTAEFAAMANQMNASLGTTAEMEAAATIAAESLIDAVAELRDINSGLVIANQTLAESYEMVSRKLDGVIGRLALLRVAQAGAGAGGGGGAAGGGVADGSTFGWVQTALNFWSNWSNVVHWAVMGTAEILSVVIPAMVAMGAAMAAMAPAFTNVKDHFTNLITASGSLTGAIGNMAGPMGRLSATMGQLSLNAAPDVWMILGSAVSIVTGHMGVFSGVAQQASNVLGSFASKVAADLAGPVGQQVAGFFSHMISDLVVLGQTLGNFGHAFMNIFSAMPGIGRAVFDALDGISKVLVVITGNPVIAGFIGIVAALSAIYRYGVLVAGIFQLMYRILAIDTIVSVFSRLSSVIMQMYGAMRFAAAEAGSLQVGFQAAGLAGQMAFAQAFPAAGALLASLGTLAAVVLPGVAVAMLEIYLTSQQAASPVEQLISQLEAMPPTVQNLAQNIVTLSQANQTETQSMQRASNQIAITNTQAAQHGVAVAAASTNVTELSNAEVALYNNLKSVETGLQSLGYTNQQTAADMAVLSIQIGLQDSQVQKLNSAWDQYLSLVVGGEAGLANFATTIGNMLTVTATSGIGNLGRDTQTLSLNLQQFQQALQAGPFGSTTGAAAWQNFDQLFTGSAQKIADWARTAKVAGAITKGDFRNVILDTAEIMSQFTGSTGAAARAVIAFAQQGDPTIATMNQLDSATGGVNQAESQLNGTMAQGAINMSNAQQIAQNLSAVFNTQVTNAIVAAALATSGFNTDVKNMMQAQQTGKDVDGKSWQQWSSLAQTAMNQALATAQTDTAAITAAWGSVPTHVSTTYTVSGQAVGTLPLGTSQSNLRRILGIPSQHGMTVGFQAGGMVGGPPGVDAIHAMLTAGEAVLNARAVQALGGPMGIHALNTQPSEAVLTAGGGGGGGGMSIQNHITVELDGRQLTSAWRVTQLTYDRRNPGPNTSLNRPGRPG